MFNCSAQVARLREEQKFKQFVQYAHEYSLPGLKQWKISSVIQFAGKQFDSLPEGRLDQELIFEKLIELHLSFTSAHKNDFATQICAQLQKRHETHTQLLSLSLH